MISSSKGHLIYCTQVVRPREKGIGKWEGGRKEGEMEGRSELRNEGEKRPRQDTEAWVKMAEGSLWKSLAD